MTLYKVAIGRSSYDIPYGTEEDLRQLKDICSKVNIMINSILATDSSMTNEFASILSLINYIYEANNISHADHTLANPASQTYTSKDILLLISHFKEQLDKC